MKEKKNVKENAGCLSIAHLRAACLSAARLSAAHLCLIATCMIVVSMIVVSMIAVRTGSVNMFTESVYAADSSTASDNTHVVYDVHAQKKGWITNVYDGAKGGTTGSSLRLEALKVRIESDTYTGGISYKVHVQKQGWTDYVSNGELAGTEGKGLRLEAVNIKLTGDIANYYNVFYRTHCETVGWTGWTYNGRNCGTEGYGKRVEAVQIKLIKKGEDVSGLDTETTAFYSKNIVPVVSYSAHVQSIGWTDYVESSGKCGTTGKSLRIEGLKIKITDRNGSAGNVEYCSYVQKEGWQTYAANGGLSGTTGKSRRIEAVRIRFTGDLEEKYDIYYRAYVQKFGWLDWAKNDEIAGTMEYGYRMEMLQIAIVHKNMTAPGATTNHCMEYVAPAVPQEIINAANTDFVAEVIRLVNVERANNGLSALAKDETACYAAYTRAVECETSFDHTRPDGRTCFTVLDDYNISYGYAGENIAMGQTTPEEVVTAWMNSSGHRANILNSNYTRIGVGFYNNYWCQLFMG